MTAEQAHAFYEEAIRFLSHPGWSARERVLALADLQERLFREVTQEEQLFFSTPFALISYAGHKFRFPGKTLRILHHFRRVAADVRAGRYPGECARREVALGAWAIAEAVKALSGFPTPKELAAHLPQNGDWNFKTPKVVRGKALARVVVVSDIPEEQCLLAYDEDNPGEPVRIRYHLAEHNENFTPTIRLLRRVFPLPVTVNLVDVDVEESGEYRPRALVIEPDYLIDVSAVAERFQPDGVEPIGFLVKKFLPYETSSAALVGQLANYFLDRLMNEPAADFTALLKDTFRLFPLVYAPMSDAEVRDVCTKAQKHYQNLQHMVKEGFRQAGIEPEHCVLEPSFFSPQYGLQGRLDLLYRCGGRTAIVELKTGRAYRPNSYGLSRSHFTQTLLYDLLVRSVFGAAVRPEKYILYSGAEENPLRFAPTVEAEQREALQVRNQLVAIDRLLTRIRPGQLEVPLLDRILKTAASVEGSHHFVARELAQFAAVYSSLSAVEKKYFNAFVGFIAREHWLAKLGTDAGDGRGGSATLWRSSLAEKEDAFSVLAHLQIAENRADQTEPVIVFRRTERTQPLANFRAGDLAVLYPADEKDASHHQVIKCTVVALDAHRVTVQLRARQFNLKPFEDYPQWNLEPDVLESGFLSLYRGLFEWAKAPADLRRFWLCPDAPEVLAEPRSSVSAADIAATPRFFLLWGPPGTGKTSVMLRDLVQWTLQNTADSVVLLAYTNRAVDEICEVLEGLGEDYIRLGTLFSTAERFHNRLLSCRIGSARTRADLLATLQPIRLFVSTISSFSQNENLLKIKTFQRLIVDEASQILEPQLIGVLTRFEHVVLIGDHRQLPAVVGQPAEHTRVADEDLRAIELVDMRDAYFDRLYRYCRRKGLHRHYGQLYHQGRMHADVMAFPNKHFYEGRLHTLPSPEGRWQYQPLPYEDSLFPQRVYFLPVISKDAAPFRRVCVEEARWVARLSSYFRWRARESGQPWSPHQSLGIITPWRAQIAQIRQALQAEGLDPDELTIDTVERYQGSARDIILLSCCVHAKEQLRRLVCPSAEGVDRKLNVALTRARQRVIVLGNPHVLQHDANYRTFIRQYALSVEELDFLMEKIFFNFISETPS